jgi:hypothetical protein
LTKTFTEGDTKTFVLNGENVDVYAKTVFRTGDTGEGYVSIEMGANKMTLSDNTAVEVGSDNTEIDGTLVHITGGVNAMTKLTIAIAAPDSDSDAVLVGDSFTDPVFGTLKLNFNSVANGPVIDATSGQDSARTELKLVSGSDRELKVEFTDAAGHLKTIPFTYQNQMRDKDGNPFITVEGNNLTDNDYFILNSGDFEHLMKVSKVNIATVPAQSDVEIEDAVTGDKYLVENKDFTLGQNVTIDSQTYVITNTTAGADAAGIKIESADSYAQTNRAIFPYVSLIGSADFPRLALVNETNLINDSNGDTITDIANSTAVVGRTYDLPTGSVQFRLTDNCIENGLTCATNTSFLEAGVTPTDGSITWSNVTNYVMVGSNNNMTVQVGKAVYVFGVANTNPVTGAKVILKNVTLDLGFTTTYAATDLPVSPVLMFVEDKDKSDSDAREVVLLNTTDSTYSQLQNVLFSGSKDYETFDNSDLTGYLTTFGTYVLQDGTDNNIKLASLTYGASQTYANVFLAEAGATITPGEGGGTGQLGDVLVTDAEVGNVASKNLIVVGGSCINSAAAALVGGAKCGAAWTTATGVGSGQFLIKGYATSSLTSKLALLVAGYDAADTANAATYLKTKAVDTSKSYIGTSATSAELVTTETA